MASSPSILPSEPSSSRPRLAPLTPSTMVSSPGTDGISRIEGYHASSYHARMAGKTGATSSPTSYTYPSFPCSPVSRRGSTSSNRSTGIAAEPVVRAGFVIPSITLTPPDARHSRSEPLPWQDFTSKKTLYVPVKTEDIGWEEGGLWWCGKFEYRVVDLYGGQDDHVVGKYRGGPEGYSYMDVWDKEAFESSASGPPRQNDEPAPQKASSSKKTTTLEKRRDSESEQRASSSTSSTSPSSSSSSTSSASSVSPPPTSPTSSAASTTPSPVAVAKPMVPLLARVDVDSPATSRRSSTSSCPSLSSTPSSSRRSSGSTKDDDDDDDDDRMDLDTPMDSSDVVVDPLRKVQIADSAIVDSPLDTLDSSGGGKAPFAKLEAALLALKAEKKTKDVGRASLNGHDDDDEDMEEADQIRSDLPRALSCTSTASQPSPLRLGKSVLLSEDGPSASHHWPRGRGVAKLAGRPDLDATTRLAQ